MHTFACASVRGDTNPLRAFRVHDLSRPRLFPLPTLTEVRVLATGLVLSGREAFRLAAFLVAVVGKHAALRNTFSSAMPSVLMSMPLSTVPLFRYVAHCDQVFSVELYLWRPPADG